ESRNIAQDARVFTEEGSDHRFGREVLRTLDVDTPSQWPATANRQYISGQNWCSILKFSIHTCRHSMSLTSCSRIAAAADGRCRPRPTVLGVRGLVSADRERTWPPRLAAGLELRDLVFVAQREPDVIEPF